MLSRYRVVSPPPPPPLLTPIGGFSHTLHRGMGVGVTILALSINVFAISVVDT